MNFAKYRAGLFLAALVLITPLASHAAVDRVIITPLEGGTQDPDGFVDFGTHYMDGSTQIEYAGQTITIGTSTTQQQIIDKMTKAVKDYSTLTGYPTNVPLVWTFAIQKNIDDSITSAISGLNLPQASAYSSPTVTLGTAFQPSATRASTVRASFRIANVLTLTGGAAGDVVMEQADNSGFTTNVVELGRCGNGNTGTLVVGLTLNDAIACQVSGDVQEGKYVRYRGATTTGTPTYTFLSARQKLLPSN